MVASELLEKGVKVVFYETEDAKKLVFVDVLSVKQIYRNLLLNAVQNSEKNQDVTVYIHFVIG